MTQQLDQMASISAAAKIVGVPRSTLYQYAARGLMPTMELANGAKVCKIKDAMAVARKVESETRGRPRRVS